VKFIKGRCKEETNIRDYLFDAGPLTTYKRTTVSFFLSHPQGRLKPQLNRHHVALALLRRRMVLLHVQGQPCNREP